MKVLSKVWSAPILNQPAPRTFGLITALVLSASAGCAPADNASSADADAGSDDSSTTISTLEGRVSLGPVGEALVSVYKLEADGSRGELLDETTTDANGLFQAEIPRDAGAIEVAAVGGTYEEEASGATVTRETTEELRSIAGSLESLEEIAVTPLTELATDRAKALKEQGLTIEDAAQLANNEIAEAAGVENILAVPADPRTPSGQSTDEARNKYAIVLAGLSQLANEKGIKSSDIARALAADFKEDGKFDGAAAGVPILIENSAHVLSGTEWKTQLVTAMSTYIVSNRNTAGFSSDQKPTVTEQPVITGDIQAPTPTEPRTRPVATQLQIRGMSKAPTNACVPLVVGTASSEGKAAPRETEVIATLTLSSGMLAYADNTCSTAIGTVTIPAYVGFKHFFAKATTDGSYTVAARDSDSTAALSEGSLDIAFSTSGSGTTASAIQTAYGGATATQLALILPAQSVTQICFPGQIGLKNEKGLPVPGSGQSVALALLGSTQSGMSFFSDPTCATLVTSLTIETGKPSAPVFLKASNAGAFTVSATSSGLTAAGATIAVAEKSSTSTSGSSTSPVASKLVVVGPEKVYANQCVPYGIRRFSAENAPAPHTADLNISLSSSGTVTALLHSDSNCSVSATQVVLKAGWSDIKFYVRAPSTGAITLTATHPSSSPAVTAGTRAVAVESGSLTAPPVLIASKLMLLAQSTSIKRGVCTSIGIKHASSDGMAVPVAGGQTVNVNVIASVTGISVFSDNTCSQTASSLTLEAGQAGKPFFVKTQEAGITITLAVSSNNSALSSASLTLTSVP